MSVDEFEKRVNAILRSLEKGEYLETLAAIDELENHAVVGADSHSVAVCCADLRLDAALATHQSYDLCELWYNNLVSLGLDARTQLLKSVIFANEASTQKRRVVDIHVRRALERAHGESLPESLVEQAEQLVAAATRGEF